jgi:hypothetical protein
VNLPALLVTLLAAASMLTYLYLASAIRGRALAR